MTIFFKYPLFFVSVLWDFITRVRNFLYDKKLFRVHTFLSVQTVVVGNLTVGGTGKTPHVCYLLERLAYLKDVGVLSRGYNRKTRGFIALQDIQPSVETVGDEMIQYFYWTQAQKITPYLYVGENRPEAIRKILQRPYRPIILLLDDGFQHRALQANLYILLSDFHRLFTDDFLMPYGNLRESPCQAKRAHIVLITKTPFFISEDKKQEICQKVAKYTAAPVFFTALEYGELQPIFGDWQTTCLPKTIGLLTSIANAESLTSYLIEKQVNIIEHFRFPDHYYFKKQDIQNLLRFYQQNSAPILCTFKDAVKLFSFTELSSVPIAYIPVKVVFLGHEIKFWETFYKYIYIK
ncbi:MAG: tetraacyldisaccharide 4'-kinase [Cytophagales bacterium]|nr:tetraacyldisaccharide 4'-kinase [Cytophagales bacterium]MDW8384068.1 tetraacyldisaccharide 4'-kinase [Flammeovirgaceae bacterium]